MSNAIKKMPKSFTIGYLVITTLLNDPDISNDDLIKKVKAKFVDSRFSKSHIAWYKHQLKNDLYIIPKSMKPQK